MWEPICLNKIKDEKIAAATLIVLASLHRDGGQNYEKTFRHPFAQFLMDKKEFHK